MIKKFKDLFISYGRRESLVFVGILHRLLKLIGYDAWFDKVNIPDGDDYQQRINHGIESAHNFICVMAPRCMTSPYCLVELEYARLLGKRVIPINQMVIFDTPYQELSEGDKQVLVGFYKRHNQPNQNIQTTQDVLNRSLALIGRTDWLAAQQKVSDEDCQHIVEWAQPYENNWAKHEDLDYLKSFKFPEFGETIDAIDGVVERITAVVERQKEYVHKHTEILANALHWQKNQKATQHLLVGKERSAAEKWLLTEFLPPMQPPCQPSSLVCEYICEARKNAENLMTDIFICYDTEDKEIRDNVIQSLSRYAKTIWKHDCDIQKGAEYKRAIEIGIENADNFFYFISPHSIASKYCQNELNHALKYNKRIVPLLIANTPESNTLEVLRELQYVDFTDNTCQADYDSDIDDILNILCLDHEYYEQHKILLARALKWESENHKPSFLLRGHNLENAKTWLRLNNKREQHSPLPLHKELITTSEATKSRLSIEVFISYSRKDADSARQLNTALQKSGKTTWFDQESIDTGADFKKEIFKGIESADNFLFILSPDAVESEYCEAEVNYAVSLGKRIITVLYRKTDPNTMPKALRIIQWLDFSDSTQFETVFSELIRALEQQKEYVHQHTEILTHALHWQKNQKAVSHLLTGEARLDAKAWLLKKFQLPEKPPCQPAPLMCELICESRKNADNLLTDIFVCSDSQDKTIRDSVIQSLSRNAKTCWQHEKDIQKGTRYEYAIDQGIEGADNFFFFLSPDSIQSKDCQRELTHALNYHKRIIPLLIEKDSEIPDALLDLQFIDFTGNTGQTDYDSKIDEILNILVYEQDYYHQHKTLLVRSRKWAAANRKPIFLLRGHKLELAKSWLGLSEKRQQHLPLPLHRELITASDIAIHQRGTVLFISYSRKDNDVVQKLIARLQEADKTVWFDQESQQSSTNTEVDFEKETFKGIDEADNFVFVASPPSVASPYCQNEIKHAASRGKRIIMLLHREVDIPETLQSVQRLDFSDSAKFETAFSELVRILERQKAYIHQHTEILIQAQQWQQNQKATQHLLVGQERSAAENWLLTEFLPPAQPPCQPTALICKFICEARKNAENLTTDIFICSEEQDKTIRDSVVRSLARYAKTCWTHDRDIQKGVQYDRAIERGIEGADNFFFFISPSSVTSNYCKRELTHALKYHKRVVPLLIIPTPVSSMPDKLRSLQYVDFTDKTSQADYESGIDEILNILKQEQDYYKQHKVLLVRALKWTEENQKSSFLLRGYNLENAKMWLRLSGKRQQNLPLAIHQELITASEAAKGQMSTEVFLSYSRKDSEFARGLNTRLQETGKTTWFDQESISSGVDFEKEILKGIDSADNFLLIVSPDAVASEYCEREVVYAAEQSKRFISVLHRETDPNTMPEVLRKINWIDFKETAFDKSFPELIQAIELDREHAHQHTVLQQRAGDWAENNKSGDFLLNQTACQNAEAWGNMALVEKKQPAPTELQQAFMQESRNAITKANRRRNILFSFVGLLAFLAVLLSVFAVFQMDQAEENLQSAKARIYHAKAKELSDTDSTMALRFAEKARQFDPLDETIHKTLRDIFEKRKPVYATPLRHSARVNSVAFSPDNQKIVTASEDNTAKVWDVQGQALATLTHDEWVYSAAFSPDSQKIVTGSNNTAKVWNVQGQPLATLTHPEWVNSAAFSPDSQKIVTRTTTVWDVQGQPLATLTHDDDVNSAAFSPDSQKIVTASRDNTATVWDVQGQALATLKHDDRVNSAAFSPDSQKIVTFDNTATVVWDVQGQALATLTHSYGVGPRSVSFGSQKIVAAFSPDSQKIVTAFSPGSQKIVAAFSPDSQKIVTASDDNTATVWDIIMLPLTIKLKNRVIAINSSRILTASENNNTATLLDMQKNKLATLIGHQKPVSSAVFSPNETLIATASEDNRVKIWNMQGKELTTFLSGHQDDMLMKFSLDNSKIMTMSVDDNVINVWDMQGNLLVTMNGHSNTVNFAAFSPDSQKIVTASDDNTAKVWDVQGQALATLTHDYDVNSAAFSPDSQKIVTTSDDYTAKVWNVQGQPLATLKHSDYRVYSAALSPDRTREVEVKVAEDDNSAAFSPDSQKIVTRYSNTAKVWDVQGQALATF
ncbi:TIR domain-containing protein, partial [Candidatus Parabeggiatoa sp. HSG14]|uniref:toll/interleukin-1 receptor domain-containing protein n=1 Tax=Candidatus Parabeggiatoa sp. HSG14 TaxID=3055593 RepID=UPI0025A7CF7B|nr:TIR domain-containing protein [Thiotrichales bacterium HSG14]